MQTKQPRRPLVVRRLLCVEDDPDIQLLFQLALGKLGGFEVKVVASGEEALQCLPAFAPDLLLLDFMLPGISGLEVLQQARCLPGFEQLQGLLITARVKAANPEAWQQPGVLGVLAKPFNPMTLADEIRHYCREPSNQENPD